VVKDLSRSGELRWRRALLGAVGRREGLPFD
jgi:hypothetical protein